MFCSVPTQRICLAVLYGLERIPIWCKCRHLLISKNRANHRARSKNTFHSVSGKNISLRESSRSTSPRMPGIQPLAFAVTAASMVSARGNRIFKWFKSGFRFLLVLIGYYGLCGFHKPVSPVYHRSVREISPQTLVYMIRRTPSSVSACASAHMSFVTAHSLVMSNACRMPSSSASLPVS